MRKSGHHPVKRTGLDKYSLFGVVAVPINPEGIPLFGAIPSLKTVIDATRLSDSK
jgi:hypothetical protein